MKQKQIFRQNSKERFEDAKILGGDPNGIINFNQSNHQWATSLYKKMCARTWFPGQINIAKDVLNYSSLTDEEKRTYKLVLSQLITNDSIQTNQLMDRINSYITSPVVNACIARQTFEESQHCYIEGTEILTSEGFKDFRNISYSNKIANYCSNGSVYFDYPKNIIKSQFDGKMVSFKMQNYQQIVTPNHRIVKKVPMYNTIITYKQLPGTVILEEADKTNVRDYDLPVAGYNIGYNKLFTPLEALAIAYQACGTLVNGKVKSTKLGYYYYKYAFKRKDKISRMKYLLSLAKLKYTITTNSNGYTFFYIWSPMKFDKNFDWVTIEDKHKHWMLNFLNELKYWDVRLNNQLISKDYESMLYTNSNRMAVDKVVAIASLCGCQTEVYKIDPETTKGTNKVDKWRVHTIFGKDKKTGREIKKMFIDYTGNVYCVTSNTGMIICRYNDTVFVSGNSESYSIMAEDIVKDTEEIYHLHEVDSELRIKNQSVEDMYEAVFAQKVKEETDEYITIKKPSKEDILMAFVANQILEELVFPGGFAALLSLENKMPGTTENINEILKDESLSHVPLFMQIFRTAIKEDYEGVIPEAVVTRATELIKKMTEAEKRWTKYATKGLLGFTDSSIDVFVEGRANSVCTNLGLPLIYPNNDNNPLEKLLKKSLRGGEMESRSNFFEVNSVEYTKGSLQVNDEWDIS